MVSFGGQPAVPRAAATERGPVLQPLGLTQGAVPMALLGPEEVARAAGIHSVIRLGTNESPFGPSPKAVTALHEEASRANRYGDPSRHDLREAIAAHHGVATANVSIGAGIDDLLGSVVRAYVAADMPAIASLGAFPTFEMHATAVGAHLERVPYRDDARIDLDGFLAAARRLGGGLIFLPNPDNPGGTSYPWSDILAFLDALPRNTLVIHDEAYANFLPQDARFPTDAVDERMIRTRTFSKEYGLAGMRVGYAIGTPGAIGATEALRLLYGVNRLAQAAALASLDDTDFVGHVVGRIADGKREYAALGQRLGIRTFPSDTNFVLFDFGDADRASRVVRELLWRGIHVRKPGVPPLDRCVRISVGAPPERAALSDALSAIVNDPGMSAS